MSLDIPGASVTPLPSTDASKVAIAAVAQRVAAWADKHNTTVTPEQCEELAEILIDFTYAFITGYRAANR
ncbi:hypothetical protein [Phytohabitans kaempferiae]|uniref:Uncharacterized protein n=1 Tax=Phytohabitans kaempferiae TaxID=1620943 RepID=A0ABV6MF08_9ACTN